MELRIKQRVFSWTDSYDVYDEYDNAKYYVKAEFFSLGHRIHIYNKQTDERMGTISQKLFSLLPTFEVTVGGKSMGMIRKKLTWVRNNYDVDYLGWRIDGDCFGWDYRVLQGEQEVMTINKKWFSWGDTYTLQFNNPANELPGLMLVIAIDAANRFMDE